MTTLRCPGSCMAIQLHDGGASADARHPLHVTSLITSSVFTGSPSLFIMHTQQHLACLPAVVFCSISMKKKVMCWVWICSYFGPAGHIQQHLSCLPAVGEKLVALLSVRRYARKCGRRSPLCPPLTRVQQQGQYAGRQACCHAHNTPQRSSQGRGGRQGTPCRGIL